MLLYALSWLLNFVIIAMVIAVVDEKTGARIENNQLLAGFLIFFLPTFIEFVSWKLQGHSFYMG